MNKAVFVKGITSIDGTLLFDLPHIAVIGRSNVGKSSTINALTGVKDLAKTSAFPGRTQQINLFSVPKPNPHYLIDLPGYGYAKLSKQQRASLQELINAYLFNIPVEQAVIFLIIDAYVGATESDLEILAALEKHHKHVIVLANKIDKIKNNDYNKQIASVQQQIGNHAVIPYSADKKKGIALITAAITASIVQYLAQ